MVSNSNPNDTRGRAAPVQETMTFPLNEQMPVTTRIKFSTYNRFEPSDGPDESTMAIISLPVPSSLRDSTNIGISKTDLGALGIMDSDHLNKATDLWSGQSLKLGWDVGKSLATDAIRRLESTFKVSALKGLALSPMLSDSNRTQFGLLAGVIQNPHTNTIFEGVGLKRHTLSWRLSPRSQQESDALNQIIRTIKKRITPAESFSGFSLDYPDTIHVTFTGPSAKYFPLMRKGMVSDFEVTMSGGDGIQLFKSGAPISYDMTLSFQEVNIVTRNTLEKEYGDGSSEITV